MILPSPFCVVVLETPEGSARFHDALAALEQQPRPPWAGWVLAAIGRTRTDVPDGDDAPWARTLWFRLEGERGALADDLPREPCPGVRLYLPGDDAPISADPLTVRGAQYVLPAALGRFLRTLGTDGEPVAPVAAPATVPEPEPQETQPEPEPEFVAPVTTPAAPQTTTGALPLLDGVTIEVAAAPGGGWRTVVARGGGAVVDDHSTAEPWADRRAVGRLTAAITAATDYRDGAVREALTNVFATLRDAPDGRALTSEPVARLINATERVEIELTNPPVYVVTLREGGALTLTAHDVAALQPITLNERWLGVRPREPLGASRRDFATVLAHWLSVAEEIAPLGAPSVWESVAEALQERLAPLPLSRERADLARYGVYQEADDVIRVSGRLIQEIIRSAGQNEFDPGFARYLSSQGVLRGPSSAVRVPGGRPIRAWRLDPSFKPASDTTTIVQMPDTQTGGATQ